MKPKLYLTFGLIAVASGAMPVLKPKVGSGDLKVVGATYSLETGSVSFLDEK